ncbi:MAG: hypothetical protein FJX33_05045 [Alphaproteobacteria bacterium]|nr:hypothetical protein [Alphaproteobacteria bacterium]
MPQSQRPRLIIRLDSEDVLADPDPFLLARNFMQARGYRLMLEAASPFAASILSSQRAGFDFLRLKLSEDFLAADSPAAAELCKKTLAECRADCAGRGGSARRHCLGLGSGHPPAPWPVD